ncbi:CRZ2 [Candida pseudojiufengensis]|uniref:CRZ2 n=1 Tax=Candida pseudojiufengensis TaxID=497109 RepID=UPI0022240B43|nr:CRZ2 [Candida pseudojiufengensis]KAI5962356.1 CRZ2 [Candida pseudojiufengensis]
MEQISTPSSVGSTTSQYLNHNLINNNHHNNNLNYNFTHDYKVPQHYHTQYNQSNTSSYTQPQQTQPLPSIFATQTPQQQSQDSSVLFTNTFPYSGSNNNNQVLDYSQHYNPYIQQQPQQQTYSTSSYPLTHYNYHNQTNNSSDQRYPLSPASISEKSSSVSSVSSTASSHYNYTHPSLYLQPPGYQHQPQAPPSTTNIDYSSLVSYTISPSLKRKRRKRKDNTTSTTKPLLPSITNPGSNLNDISESFPCTLCDKVFQKPYNLKSHMKTHSSDKPFPCSYCSKTFARSHDKKRHEVLHQGIKNFKCEGYLQDGITKWGCGKKFARSDALSRHFRTETGWLCIRPLMDEAKRLEVANNNNNNGVIPVNSNTTGGNESGTNFNTLPNSIDFKSLGNDEFFDNSKLIRKLIHSK